MGRRRGAAVRPRRAQRLRQAIATTRRSRCISWGWGSSCAITSTRRCAFFERVLAFSDLSAMSIYAKALNNAGMCYSRLGQFERAIDVQRRAVDLQSRRPRSADYEQALGPVRQHVPSADRRPQGVIRAALGSRGDVVCATRVRGRRDAGMSADATLWAGNLAQAHIESGQWDEAERYNEEAKRLWTATRSGNPVYYTYNSARSRVVVDSSTSRRACMRRHSGFRTLPRRSCGTRIPGSRCRSGPK